MKSDYSNMKCTYIVENRKIRSDIFQDQTNPKIIVADFGQQYNLIPIMCDRGQIYFDQQSFNHLEITVFSECDTQFLLYFH